MITFTADKLKQARDSGYSDDEIWGFASQQDDRFAKAKEAGYSLDEVSGFFSEQQSQQEPATPAEPAPPVGTSLMAEIAALPQALQRGIEQPTEAMGETATALGMPALGETLRGAVEAPKDYVPAAQRFMEPQEGEFQIAGFAPQYLPRAAVEQAPQVIGTVLSGIGGRAIGGVLGLPLGPKGVVAGQVAGQFLGPALFEMSQIVGPVARERAANQGREEPNTDDLAWAWATAGASGSLNAIGAKYLPFGDDIASGLAKSVSKAFAGEFTTEGAQAVVQQAGESFLTEKGLDIKPKQALGEAIIGGVSGGGVAAVAAPFTPAVKAAAAAETKVVAEQAAPVAPETAQVVSEQANQVIAQAQAEETTETPDERVARLQREAQEAAGEIELEEEPPVSGLPPVEPTPPVTPTPEAAVAPVEPVVPAEGAVEPAVTEVAPTRNLADLEVRPPTDNVQQVAAANDLTVGRADVNIPAQELESTVNLSDPKERERVDNLKKQISSEGGFISRVIVDGQNNVVEGQHRVQAMKELGYDQIPAVQLKSAEDFIPDSNALDKVMQDAGLTASDNRTQMRQLIAEIISDEKGDVTQLREYEAPAGFETAWNAATEEVIRQNAAPEAAPVAVEPTPVTPTPVTPEVPTAEQGAGAFNEFIREELQRQVDEQRGQQVLDAMEQAGESPRAVVEDFYRNIYDNLTPDVRARFDKYVERLGWSVPATMDASPKSVGMEGAVDLGNDVQALEGIERGFVALAKTANDLYTRGPEVPPTPELVAPTPTLEPPALAPLRRVARAEQTEEDVAGLVDGGLVEIYNGQPVITQAGLDALPEAERPRLTPEARKIQIDTRTSEAAAEAISKNLRIGVDQVPVDVRMPAGWTLVGDVYVPPQPQAAPVAPTFAKGEMVRVTNRVPTYEGGRVVGGRDELVAGSVTRIMPDGKVEVRMQRGGYQTLAPNEVQKIERPQAPTPTPEVREARREPAITPQQDKDYLDAVERGDMETAQRMVEDAARAAGYSVRVYHGTNADFWEFRPSRSGNFGPAIYVAFDRKSAESYAKRLGGQRIIEGFAKITNPFRGGNANEVAQKFFDSFPANTDAESIRMAQDAGYDAIIADQTLVTQYGDSPPQAAIFNPEQIKSADPVTYDNQGNIIPLSQRFQPEQADIRYRRRVQMGRAGMETSAVEARLQELGFPTGGIIRVVNEPDAYFEGRTIILDGKVTGIELNAAAMRDNATIDRVLNHEFAESANADGALNKLVERLTPKEKKEINDTITRLRYEERARTSEEAARAIETLAEAWKGRGFFTRAVARVEAWASKLGFKLTRRAAEYIAARNLADINSGFRTAYNQFINVRGEVREGRTEDQAVVDADMGRRSQTELTPQEIDQLEKGEKIRVYRAMQIIDGKLYPPMSALVGGKLRKPTEIGAWEKAEERPDLLDKKGKFVLQKGNKTTVPAAYNPYFHTSSSPLNDQFSSAYKRDNLVTVEVEIPASELTSGYKAEGAKDAVGEVRWNAGPVSSKLPADKKRRVFLSRYAKVVRIVPDSEVAEVISGLLEGTNLSIPENTVTPSLRSELEKRGVAVTPRPARGQEIRESRREPEAIPTFTEGTPEAATLKEMATSMAKVDAASEAKGGKPETYKISEIASVWMDSGLGERELQDAIVEYTNLTPANAAKVAKAIAKQYGLQQQIAETGAVISEIAPEPEGAPRKSAVTKLIEQTTGVRKPVVKLQVSESAALKKQIQLKAREARETRKARKEAAEDLAKAITDYVKANPIRGPINSRQAMSITKKALKLDVNNEAAVDRFEMYVERVIENANYDRDLADARSLIKRAKAFAKAKGTEGNVKVTLEAIANVAPTLLNNPFEFNLVVQRYLLGLAPVTAKQYAVMPDADVRRYLESLETQIKDNQEVLDRSKAQRILDKQAAYANEKGIPLDEAIAILNSEEFLQEKTIEKLEDLTKLLTSMAQESQKDVKAYDDAGATPKQKELISFMRKVNLDSLTNEEKKRYIRFSNNLLANGATFGMEQFQSIALGQEAAMKAVKDRRLSDKLAAWISPIGGDKAIDTARKIALRTQSEADTFKNIFGRQAVGVFRNVLGLNRLDAAQTASNNAKEQIASETAEYYKGLKKEYGEDATNFEAKGYAGVAGYLIQAEGNKTEVESIAYRRRLMEQSIAELRKSDMQSDQAEADLKERALAQLTGTSNTDILSQLKAINPASYEQLIWWKDTMLPKWRDFLKEHDENFRNQANNYNNPDHLTITYKFPEGQLLPNEIEDVYQQDMVGMRIKQAANSIKRKEHANLPVSKTGTVANIDINFGYNQYNALVDQVDKAFVAPAWEQVVAFTNDKNFEQIMGGRANALFVKKLLTDIQTSRTRQSMTDDEAQLLAGGVRLARKISTQAVLGGATQPLRQVPDQLSKLFFTTGRWDLIVKNLLKIAEGAPLMNKFPIGRRGDAQAGTQYASQFSELARKVEASVTDRKWAKYRELMNKVGEFWMTPLRGSDVWAAKVSWMTYYESDLNKKGIKMESWEREAELVDTDQARKDAAAYAEWAVDFYGGASDPTKMAALSRQTNNGWKEFAKLLFLPLNSFALQQKNSLISDLRDAYLRTGDRKASIAAVAGTLAGMAAFHATRIYIIGGLIYPAGKALLMGIFGIDMDEPDEEEKQKQLEDNWRKFKASMYGNIVAGGLGEFVEKNAIDAVNRTAYLWDANINPDSLLNDKGEIMSFRQYEKEVSPLYRFRSYGSSEYSFGLADVLTEQATHALAETQQLMTPEEMEKYTGNEQAYAAFATGVEWMYFFRLMDTDVKRIATDLKRQMDKDVKEREAEIRAIRNL